MAFAWVQFVFGLWLVLAPWLLGYASVTVMKWNSVLIGTALAVINAWVLFGGKSSPKVDLDHKS